MTTIRQKPLESNGKYPMGPIRKVPATTAKSWLSSSLTENRGVGGSILALATS
jgi:hypothetical protein